MLSTSKYFERWNQAKQLITRTLEVRGIPRSEQQFVVGRTSMDDDLDVVWKDDIKKRVTIWAVQVSAFGEEFQKLLDNALAWVMPDVTLHIKEGQSGGCHIFLFCGTDRHTRILESWLADVTSFIPVGMVFGNKTPSTPTTTEPTTELAVVR